MSKKNHALNQSSEAVAEQKAPEQEKVAFPEPEKEMVLEAREEGIKQAIVESTKKAYLTGANEGYGENTSTNPADRFQGSRDVFNLQPVLELGIDDLNKRIDANQDNPITESQIVGLLEMERSGKNRTPVVKALCQRLGIKNPQEVTAAGPAFTNDVTPTTKLEDLNNA